MKTRKEVVDKGMNDFHVKLSDAMNRSKWRRMGGGNWTDRSTRQ